MDSQVSGAFAVLPAYLSHHVLLSAAALALGLSISLPLALAVSRWAAIRWPVMTFVSVIQTIPSLALMALFYPLLLALAALSTSLLGHGFSALGFLPALIALTLYSMLPIIRNTVTGLAGLDPAAIEAARGVGMTPRQRLLQVELPLAAPVIMAGVRTSAVWTIGAATLSTPVGQTSLGNYIFSGLQTENWVWVLFGCAASALLAITVDQLLGLMQDGAARRTPWKVAAGALALAAGVIAAGMVIFSPGDRRETYVVGAKNFTEQYILADLIALRLQDGGELAAKRTGLGSAVAFRALTQGDIDVYVDYTGTIWTTMMGRADQLPREEMLAEIDAWLEREHGVRLVGPLGFENAYALAMPRGRAGQLGVSSIADLTPHAPRLSIGSDYEFFARPEWTSLQRAYGLDFGQRREFQSTFMYRAASAGDVDVITAFSSDGRIELEDLLVLDDPRAAIPPYDAIVMVAPDRADDPALIEAATALVTQVTVERMREANSLVDRDGGVSPLEAARWLDREIRRGIPAAAP